MFGFGNHEDTYTASGEKKLGGYLTGEAGFTETLSKIYHLFTQ